MAFPLLRRGSLREYNALGVLGNPVFAAAAQLSATVRRQLGADAADLLASPQINEAGDSVDWYAPFDGPVVPWSSATYQEQLQAKAQLHAMMARYEGHGAQLLGQLGNGNRRENAAEVFARMLPLAVRIPDDTHIYLVGGRPVLTFWGFERLNAPLGSHVIRDLLPVVAAPAAVAAASAAVGVAAPVVAAPTGRGCLRWLLLALFLLVLLPLLLVGLHACSVPLPGWVASVPGVGLIAPDLRGPDVVVPDGTVPGVVVPGVIVPGVAVPGGGVAVPGAAVPALGGDADKSGQSPADQTKDGQNKDGQPVPPQPDQTQKPDDQKSNDPKADDKKGADDKTPPNPDKQATPVKPPLIIPDAAAKNGSTSFLDGHWRSQSGLMDSETGRPLEMEYDFKDGKGTATIHRNDGSACTAGATAAMQAGKLVIDQTGDVVCPDGQKFDRSKVECTAGKDGKAACRGVHADAKDGYRVEIVK